VGILRNLSVGNSFGRFVNSLIFFFSLLIFSRTRFLLFETSSDGLGELPIKADGGELSIKATDDFDGLMGDP
jgi:hypothetical protein